MIEPCLQDSGAKPTRAGRGCFGTGASRTVQGEALLDPPAVALAPTQPAGGWGKNRVPWLPR